MGLGPKGSDAMGGGVLFGEESSITRPRAQSVSSISKERGASGDADPLVGMTRVAMLMEVFAVVKWGLMIDKVLRHEASRYIETSSLFVEGWELSSSTFSSGFDRAVLKEGAFAGFASMIVGEEQLPLSIILVDGNNGEMVFEGEKSLVGEGVGGEFEDLLQDLEGKGCRWDDSCLARFNKFLGFSTEGFEGEILNMLLRTKRRREQNNKGISGSIKFDRELKKLEWSINYNGARKEKSLVREGGARISNLR